MEWLKTLWAKVLVIVKALPTWLSLAVMVLTVFSEEVVGLLPDAMATDTTRVVVLVVGWLTAAINIIRRVSPVLPEERGILPTTTANQ